MVQKIGILGGTFNPPHLGHLIMANEAKEQLDLDKIWFLPNQLPPHKEEENLASAQQRLEMLQGATANNPFFAIDERELHRSGKSYTYDTIKAWKAESPDSELYFIIGGDMVEFLPKWYKIDELIKFVHFVGVNRRGHHRKSPYPVIKIDIPVIEISSTIIRDKVKQNSSIQYLVPDNVANYIKENHLYD